MKISFFKSGSTGSVVISLLIGVLCNIYPWGSSPWVPDFLIVILAFWVLHTPDKVNLLAAFLLGILMDIQTSQFLGIHSITYLIATFLMILWTRRLLNTTLFGQFFIIFQVLLISHTVQILILWLSNASHDVSFTYIVVPSLIESLLWLMISKFLIGQTSNFSRNHSSLN
jgi:rod shape-determining protein MreD